MEEYGDFEEFDDIDIQAVFADEQENEDSRADGSTNTASTSTASTSSGGNQMAKKKRIPRPKSKYTLDSAIAEQATVLEETLLEVANDEFVNEPSFQHAPAVKTFAERCQQNQDITNIAVLLTLVIQAIWPAISASDKFSTAPARAEASFSGFFKLRTDANFIRKVTDFLRPLSGVFVVPHMFCQMFLRILFEKLLLRHEKIEPAAGPATTTNSSLSFKEKNALRYVAGYIVNRLPRKIKNKSEREQMTRVIDDMKKGSERETRLSFTKEWVETQSRGGLTMVNDATFLFFQKLEETIRQQFPTETCDLVQTDLRTPINSVALQDRVILEKWTLICGPSELSEHASLIMLQILVGFYTQIRLFSFTRNIVERYKIKEKADKKQSKGLRGALKRASSAQD